MINWLYTAHTGKHYDMEFVETLNERPVATLGEKFFEDLYEKAFPPFARFAAKMNASFEDAKDIFHDALVIYYEKSAEEESVIRISPEAYIMGIAKHLWIRKYKRDRHRVSLSQLESSISLPVDYYAAVNEIRLLKFMEQSGKKCLELLQKFYFEKTPLRNIAAALGYRSEHSAAVQKFKCIGKMRDAIKSKAMEYEDFLF